MSTDLIPLVVAAQRLRLPYHAVYNAILTGELTGERIGARWWVRCDDVAVFQTRSSSSLWPEDL